ncbi:MAG: hypothetical protein RQ751_08465 [Longimicrobiales bacterium]|nr:hypothetical protein [Longimicrobiales bacterium]
MSNIEALKEQARRHEEREEWQAACDLYLRALGRLSDEEQPDIGLYNRVGDLQVRLGNYEGAVENFDRATELYLESELPNNAIAVCKKILRHIPTRYQTYLRMARVRAEQGFRVDAREYFLAFAEKAQGAGEMESALGALGELANLMPEDADVRLAVADQFAQHDRGEEALDQLGAGYGIARAGGDEDTAALFAERILALDPEADLEALGQHGFPGGGFAQAGGPGPEPGFGAGSEFHFQDITLADDEASPASPPDATTAGAFLSSAGGSFQEEADASGEGGESPDEVVADFAEISPGTVDSDPEDDEDDGEDAADLPFLVSRSEVSEEGLEQEEGSREETPAIFEIPAARDPRDAWAELRDRYLEGSPDVSEAESVVEAAFRVDDAAVVVESYLLLADALARADDGGRAGDVLRQVLTLDPANDEARDALAALAAGVAAPEPGEDASVPEEAASAPEEGVFAPEDGAFALEEAGSTPDEDAGRSDVDASERGSEAPSPSPPAAGDAFVDLGSLIFADTPRESTTRFQVAYEEPSGDEDADFTRMLEQFKSKVAENFHHSDVRAHHDLGTAYLEMGLLDEAVEKFQAALRAAPAHLPTYELLGQTFLQRGEAAAAVRVLERALRVPTQVEDEYIGIYYHLARAQEDLGRTDAAVEFYDRVFALDINFADVTERLRQLR